MKYATNLATRSGDLKEIIDALNSWALSPGGAPSQALKKALGRYHHAVKNGTYEPIAWEFAYARNTLNKKTKPNAEFLALFDEQEAIPKTVRGESPTSDPNASAAPWEE